MKSSMIVFSCCVKCSLVIVNPYGHLLSLSTLFFKAMKNCLGFILIDLTYFFNSSLVYTIPTKISSSSPPHNLSLLPQIHLPSASPKKTAGLSGTSTQTQHNKSQLDQAHTITSRLDEATQWEEKDLTWRQNSQ